MTQSAAAIAAAVLAGRLTPPEVAEDALDRAAALNPALNAITTLDRASVMAEAAALTARLAAGECPPLAGVPVVVKDNIWVAGRRVTQGSRLFADHVAPRDAIAVARLRAAGALILGMSTCSEFACKGQTTTPLYGVTRNPVDPALTPGGSSGGSAAALAAGMVPVALGTDGGGSGRRPAAHCGVLGFKPTQGAIPYGPGFAEPFWDICTIAPMARTADDLALLFDALAGPDPRDPVSGIALLPARPVQSVRIAFAPTMGRAVAIDDDVAAATARAVEALRADGLTVAAAAPDWPDGGDEGALMALQFAGLAALHGPRWRAEPALFDPDIGGQIEQGLATTGADVARALNAGRAMRAAMAGFFADYDLLLCPTTPCPAWPVDRSGPDSIGGRPAQPRGHAVFTPQINHARAPALSLPCGANDAGLPLGLQIVGAVGADRTVLSAARHFERLFQSGGLTPAPTGDPVR